MITVFFDGSSSPHKKNYAAAAVCVYRDTTCLDQSIYSLPPKSTNNEAEFIGLIQALKFIEYNHFSPRTTYRIMGDSKLAIDTCNYIIKPKKPTLQKLSRYIFSARTKLSDKEYTVGWVPRKFNKAGILLEKHRRGTKFPTVTASVEDDVCVDDYCDD